MPFLSCWHNKSCNYFFTHLNIAPLFANSFGKRFQLLGNISFQICLQIFLSWKNFPKFFCANISFHDFLANICHLKMGFPSSSLNQRIRLGRSLKIKDWILNTPTNKLVINIFNSYLKYYSKTLNILPSFQIVQKTLKRPSASRKFVSASATLLFKRVKVPKLNSHLVSFIRI